MPDSQGKFKGIVVPDIPWGTKEVTVAKTLPGDKAGERFPVELPDGSLATAVVENKSQS